MRLKNFIFVIAILGSLASSCTPQNLDEDTQKNDIKATTQVDKTKIVIPPNG